MSQVDENLFIDTPENITFEYEIAGIGSRFLAALVDTTLIALLQILVNGILVFVLSTSINFGESISAGTIFSSSASWVIALIGLISFFFFWGYYIFFEMIWNGQSPGKSLARLRVIRTDGTPITLTESIVRNLVRLIDFLPAYYGVGVISMFVNRQSRRLGDLAAGTLVVRENAERISLKSLAPQEIRLPRPAQEPGAGGAETAVSTEYPVERLTAQDIQMIESFLGRREDLQNRSTLALQLARAVLARMGLPDGDLVTANQRLLPENVQGSRAEEILARVLQAYRSRSSGGQ